MAAKFLNTPDTTAQFDPQDIELNNRLSLLSYLGILVLIPIFLVKRSRFAKFHANQGLVLLIADVAINLVLTILKLIVGALRSGLMSLLYRVAGGGVIMTLGSVLGGAVNVVFWLITVLVSAALIAIAVLGIINAVKGRAKELPLIGRFRILKGF